MIVSIYVKSNVLNSISALMLQTLLKISRLILCRRNRLKPLLGSRRQPYSGSGDIYQDPAQAFNYSQMNSAYSTETMNGTAMYQDPALIHRPKGGRPHANSVASNTGLKIMGHFCLPSTCTLCGDLTYQFVIESA